MSQVIAYPVKLNEGQTHVSVIQGFIRAGHDKKVILDAYVAARFPEVVAGTLLREKHGSVRRTLADPKQVSLAKSLLRKHGNTHYKMADAEMSEASIASRVAKADASVEANRVRLANATAKAAQAKKDAATLRRTA